MLEKVEIGDIVDLDWIHGYGHGKVVGVYLNYAMVIHPCSDKPMVAHIENLESVKSSHGKH